METMTTTLRPAPTTDTWPPSARTARLHFVTGKGGTGKTTLAAALALALGRDGKRVLLIETEERQSIAQLFDLPPLPYEERRIALAPGGGEVRALAIDVEAALLDYFALFYNLGFAARSLKKMGAVEFATTLAPGLRDVLITGKIKETVTRKDKAGQRVYDAVVVDAPPTGRIVTFLNVTLAMADLARRGPIHSQASGVISLLHSPDTCVHLVTVAEEMPATETLEGIEQLRAADFPVGTIVVNRYFRSRLPAVLQADTLDGAVDTTALKRGLTGLGVPTDPPVLAGLREEMLRHAQHAADQQRCHANLADAGLPLIDLPDMPTAVQLGELYELADILTAHGVQL
jgi:anion-transporting  ArsA/GET3 family ATPase